MRFILVFLLNKLLIHLILAQVWKNIFPCSYFLPRGLKKVARKPSNKAGNMIYINDVNMWTCIGNTQAAIEQQNYLVAISSWIQNSTKYNRQLIKSVS